MALWNEYVGRWQGRGLRHMDAIAREFVTERGCELVALGLYRNCLLHLAALQQEGVIAEAALLLAMVGLQQALVARGAALPLAHPGEPGAGGGAGALPGDGGAAALVEGEEA